MFGLILGEEVGGGEFVESRGVFTGLRNGVRGA